MLGLDRENLKRPKILRMLFSVVESRGCASSTKIATRCNETVWATSSAPFASNLLVAELLGIFQGILVMITTFLLSLAKYRTPLQTFSEVMDRGGRIV